jgi:hypothetical protein
MLAFFAAWRIAAPCRGKLLGNSAFRGGRYGGGAGSLALLITRRANSGRVRRETCHQFTKNYRSELALFLKIQMTRSIFDSMTVI